MQVLNWLPDIVTSESLPVCKNMQKKYKSNWTLFCVKEVYELGINLVVGCQVAQAALKIFEATAAASDCRRWCKPS